jgi:hypothetical protein
MIDDGQYGTATNIIVSLPTNATERVSVVVFIIFHGDVRFVSLKITNAAGVSHPRIENLNQPIIDYSSSSLTKDIPTKKRPFR